MITSETPQYLPIFLTPGKPANRKVEREVFGFEIDLSRNPCLEG